MFKRLNWILALIMLLSLPALACGVFGGDEAEPTAVPPAAEPAEVEAAAPEPAADPTTEPTAEPVAETAVAEPPVQEPAAEESEAPPVPASALDLASINQLPFDSYRIEMVLEFSGVKADGTEVNQAMNANFAVVVDPPANSMSMGFSGIEEAMGMDTIEMAQIEDTTYMVLPEMGCITTQGQDILQDNPFADMLAPNEFMSDLEDAKYEGEETINNIRTRHYSFDKFAFGDTGTDEIEEAEGHIYIAKDGDFLVRMVIDASGQIDFFDEGVDQDGELHIEINLTDVDENVEIVMPAGCEGQTGSGSEFPMMGDAYEVSSLPGLVSYKTDATTDETLLFYEEALMAEGWVKDEAGSFVGGGSALVAFSRDGESLNLSISPDDNGGTFVVLISETEG